MRIKILYKDLNKDDAHMNNTKTLLTCLLFHAVVIAQCDAITNLQCTTTIDESYPSSIFIPRQLSYNPVLENALALNNANNSSACLYASIKPVYTQSTGKKFNTYFTINHQETLNIQENGSGDIDPLWFQVISSDDTYYSSKLSFCPTRKTYGALLFIELQLPYYFSISLNTALVTAQNSMHMFEKDIQHPGTAVYKTVSASYAASTRTYGKICGTHTKTGIDDIQLKILKNVIGTERCSWDVYVLAGIPTGKGAKSIYLFEPLVGSRHAQLGLGSYYTRRIHEYTCGHLTFLSELKWRYGLCGTERRLYDLNENGQWSRYMLLVNQSDLYTTFFASNKFALETKVTPRNSLDIFLALNACHNNWHAEIGYDFWYRNREKIALKENVEAKLGIADLIGIAALSPTSASTATISQSVSAGTNQMQHDASFVAIKNEDLNLNSGAAPESRSNTIYGSIGYTLQRKNHETHLGINVAYERGHKQNVPDNVFVWVNVDISY